MKTAARVIRQQTSSVKTLYQGIDQFFYFVAFVGLEILCERKTKSVYMWKFGQH